MQLAELVKGIAEYRRQGDADIEISGVTCDSRAVRPGMLFVALRGSSTDGHRYIVAAVQAGAAAVLLEDAAAAPGQVPWLQVKDGRSAMGLMAARFYGDPTATLPLIGITGTNGKTTTTYLLEGILGAAGTPPAVLGTISYRFGNTVVEASHTTPESTELQAAFRQLGDAGAKAFVMEVSSHALEQKRVAGCHFDVGIFSNLTRDHLDYHKTMESYLASKQLLFSELLRPDAIKPHRRAVINMDDPYGASMAAVAVCPVVTYAVDRPADVTVTNARLSVEGISGTLVTPAGTVEFRSRLLGRFNLYNLLAAAAGGFALGISLDAIRKGIEGHQPVPGRMERVENHRGVTVLVDYAHTGDALENVLRTVSELATGRIITVFGCGGDRDPGKRPIMGGIAAAMSDLAIVTSDNPRTEDPHAIMAQIRGGIIDLPSPQGEGRGGGGLREYTLDELAGGFDKKGFVMLENRRDAIRLAVQSARSGDIVVLAGKGHEDYQIIGKVKQHFDDREEAAAALGAKL